MRDRLAALDKVLEALLNLHPDAALIRSLPGMGAVLAAQFVARQATSPASAPPMRWPPPPASLPFCARPGDPALAAAPSAATRTSNAYLYMAAFCATMSRDPRSRAYYDRKRREGKRHTQALIALARRQTTVLWCMLKHRTSFDPHHRNAA